MQRPSGRLGQARHARHCNFAYKYLHHPLRHSQTIWSSTEFFPPTTAASHRAIALRCRYTSGLERRAAVALRAVLGSQQQVSRIETEVRTGLVGHRIVAGCCRPREGTTIRRFCVSAQSFGVSNRRQAGRDGENGRVGTRPVEAEPVASTARFRRVPCTWDVAVCPKGRSSVAREAVAAVAFAAVLDAKDAEARSETVVARWNSLQQLSATLSWQSNVMRSAHL